MVKSLLSNKTAIGALAVTAVLGGGVAFAYPPGTPLTVSATAAPSTDPANPGSQVTVTVTGANPTCTTLIEVDGQAVGQPLGLGVSTTVVHIGSTVGRHRVAARTVDCAKGQKEHDSNQFVIQSAKAVGDSSTVKVRKRYGVDFSGFLPDSAVTVVATLLSANPNAPLVQVHDSDTANKRGEGKTAFRFPQAGIWVVTATSATQSAASFQVVVNS